jgi:hypothetical protein
MSAGFAAYPLAAAAAGTAEVALAAAGVLTALAAPFYILWLEGKKHHAHSGVANPPSYTRDITDVPDGKHDPDDPPETIYHYTGNYVSDANEIGYGHREKKYIAHSFQNWAMHMYGQRYKFLTGVALAVARRRYRKWRLHGPYAQHTPLLRQIREEIDPFRSPRKKRPRKYTRSELYAL